MEAFITVPEKVFSWLKKIGKEQKVYFPQKKGAINYAFAPVTEKSELSFDNYRPTILPPIKKIFPMKSEIFRFTAKGATIEVDPVVESEEQVYAGVRPCDLKSILLYDMTMTEDVDDPHYTGKRNATSIIAYRCEEPCDEDCFCDSVNSLEETRGADIILTPVSGSIIIEPVTEKGSRLLGGSGFEPVSDPEARKKNFRPSLPKPYGRHLNANITEMPRILKKTWDSGLWETYTEKCFSCGTCNLVCPTCYCFRVQDDIELDVVSGNRTRFSDSCMLKEFAQVAGDHNFRGKPEERQRHRIYRKFDYLQTRYEEGSFCVGCGRCGRQCTAGIDIFDIANDLIKEGGV